MASSATTLGSSEAELSGCPHYSNFDPLSPAVIANPFPWLATAQHERPIFYLEKYDLWVVTRHEDVHAVYKDMATFSNGSAHQPLTPKPQSVVDRVGEDWNLPVDGNLNSIDPPVHGPMKRTLTAAFTKSIKTLGPWIEEQLERIVDQFVDDGEADLVSSFTWPLTVATLARLIGAPASETERFKEWAENWFELTGSSELSEERAEACWMGFVDFEQYVFQLIAERRRAPQDDLVSTIIEAQAVGAALTDREIVTNMIGLVAAGTDTTANSIGQMMHMLLTHPDQFEEVRENPAVRANMIEEVLRLRVPVRGLIRKVMRPVTLGGVELPEGAHVFIHIGAASRDPALFEQPDRFDIHRGNSNKHVAFGAYTRMCLGAPLARLEMTKALEIMMRRLPDLRLSDRQGALEYTNSMIVPSLKRLWVRWTPPGEAVGGSR